MFHKGTLNELKSDQYVRREAEMAVALVLVDNKSGTAALSKQYSANKLEGSIVNLASGIFGSIEELRLVVERTLQELVDKSLDDSEFRVAVR